VIARVTGRLVARDLDRVEVLTAGGAAYELAVPLSTFEALPRLGEEVTLFTHLVVRDDAWALYGFATALERELFRRLLGATGVGPALALGMLSRFPAERLVRAITERDVGALQSIPRVGKKKAEQLVLDLAEKLQDLVEAGPPPLPRSRAAEDAVRGLVALGYSVAEAQSAVREVLARTDAPSEAADIIRDALPVLSKR
jgi:Holliday junction DNA helicase RuvA